MITGEFQYFREKGGYVATTACDGCGKIGYISRQNYNRLQERKDNNGKTFCRNCGYKERDKRYVPGTKKSWNKGTKLPFEKSGRFNPKWKGGSYLSKDGYHMVNVGSYGNRGGWVSYKKAHRVYMEEYLGRKLTKEEHVHHKDGYRLNNRKSNLVVLSNSEHKKAHYSLQDLGYELYRSNLVHFDEETKKYIFSDKIQEFIKSSGSERPIVPSDPPFTELENPFINNKHFGEITENNA